MGRVSFHLVHREGCKRAGPTLWTLIPPSSSTNSDSPRCAADLFSSVWFHGYAEGILSKCWMGGRTFFICTFLEILGSQNLNPEPQQTLRSAVAPAHTMAFTWHSNDMRRTQGLYKVCDCGHCWLNKCQRIQNSCPGLPTEVTRLCLRCRWLRSPA